MLYRHLTLTHVCNVVSKILLGLGSKRLLKKVFEIFLSEKCLHYNIYVPTDLVLEPNYSPGASHVQDKSPAGLPYWSPSLPVKIEF